MNNKISAEEKHYIKLNIRLRQEINDMQRKLDIFELEKAGLRKSLNKSEAQVAKLQIENNILVENSGLTPEEIKKLIKTNDAVDSFVKMSGLRMNY